MKSIALIYRGPLPEVHVHGITAARAGKPITVSEPVATELLARGDFIEAAQTRDTDRHAPMRPDRGKE